MKNFYLFPTRVCLLWIILLNFTFTFGQNKIIPSQLNSVSNGLAPKVFDKNAPAKLSSLDLVQQNQSLNISPIEAMKGKPEDLAKRDAFSKHFKNADGSYTAVVASGPVHYQKNGQWEDIDTKISKNNNGVYAYSNTANLLESYFGNTAQKGVMSKTSKGEVKEFLNTTMYWEVNGQKTEEIVGADVAAKIAGDKLFYNNIFGDISAEFTVITGKRKLNYIIPNREALGIIPTNAEYLVFSEDIVLPQGWTYRVTDKENVEIKNAEGKLSFIYGKPCILENYKEGEAYLLNEANSIFFDIINNENGFTFLVKVDASWLTAIERKFPIAVDPTVYPDNIIYWTGWATTIGGNNDDIFAGFYSDGNAMAGYSKFNLTTIPTNSLISSAQVNYYYFARTGNLRGGRQMALVDIPIDPVPATYNAIATSPTQYLSNSVIWTNNGATDQDLQHWKNFLLTANGLAYVQDALAKGYVAVAAYPLGSANWIADNYAGFQGYSDANKPELVINYTTTCTTPSSSANTYFINNVQFLGTLIADTTSGNTGYSATGYSNSNTNMATQIPGGVINVYVSNNNIQNFTKAWVDWNKNNVFDSTEKVYDSGNILIPNTTFGFVVPVGTAPNTYKIRIRNYNYSPYFGACGPLSNGETEDYTFTVIADCAAKITAVNVNPGDGKRCGSGAVVLSASGTGTSYQWYTSQFSNTPIPGETGSAYTTGVLPIGTTTFYVTAVNGCESVYRTPVKAVVSPTPTITFSQTSPDICGSASSLSVSSSGDKEEVTLLNEGFGSTLGLFTNQITGNTNVNAVWQQRPSPYVLTTPPYYALKPALSSGYNNGSFAMISTDVNQNSNILNNLVLTNNADTSGFLNLKLDFDLFYYSMIDSDVTYGYLKVDYSINGGTGWTNLTTITTDQGSPSLWSNQSISLPAVCLNQPNFKIRFSVFAYGANNGWIADLASIDNVRLYGDKPLATNFAWTGGAGSIYNAGCSTPYSGAAPSVCINPSALQIENDASWSYTATAILSNGCSASGTITINNNTKTWNTTSTDWATNNWKPTTVAPDATKCVVIKQPVIISSGTTGLAKNIVVKPGGNLDIQGNLAVTDFVNNETSADQFVVNNDANLMQTTETAVNVGDITVLRNSPMKKNNYTYWSSPVAGRQLGAFSPLTSTARFYEYIESTNLFKTVPKTDNFIPTKGYAIMAPSTYTSTTVNTTFVGKFIGVPTNGTKKADTSPLEFPLQLTPITPNRGFNMIGNPYPSNIDFEVLYALNSTKIYNTAYFWTNVDPNRPSSTNGNGDAYTGNAYAIYNGTGGVPATTSGPGTGDGGTSLTPTQFIKVGQGFIVKAKQSGQLIFNNSIRNAVGSSNFMSKGASSDKDRYWLKLTTPAQNVNTILIGYIAGATNDFERDYDAPLMSVASDSFYSILNENKLGIQGKTYPLNTSDVVPLGTKHFEDGNYTVSLGDKEGIFANGQNIYLKDNQTGIITNLSEGSYSFNSAVGEFSTRFEIIYRPQVVLATDGATKENLQVYRDGTDFVVKSSDKTITRLEVYDGSGRMLMKLAPKNKEARIPAAALSNGMYILLIDQHGEVTSRKVVK